MTNQQSRFQEALLASDRLQARTVAAAAEDQSAQGLIDALVVPALDEIGALWDRGEAALSQVYVAGKICEELVDELLPPGRGGLRTQPRMAIAVLDDYHFLGKRIVYSMLRASGFEVQDYGRQTVAELWNRVREDRLEVLLVSVLMLPSALEVKVLKEGLVARGLGSVKVVVGGAPFRLDPELGAEVGADAVCATASEGLAWVNRFAGHGGAR